MLSKIVNDKEMAFKNGTKYMNILVKNYLESSYYNMISDFNDKNIKDVDIEIERNNYIGTDVLEVMDYIYNDDNFFKYLRYSFMAKKYERKLIFLRALIRWLYMIFIILVSFGSYFLFGFGLIFIVASICVMIGFFFVNKSLYIGESYDSYYDRTMLSFLINVYHNLVIDVFSDGYIDEYELKKIIDDSCDIIAGKNNISFNSSLMKGSIFDLELSNVIDVKYNDDGDITFKDKRIFNGFYLKIDFKNNYNMFKGNMIKIKSHDSVISSLFEDTVKNICENELELFFNSEELNNSFDLVVSGYNGFASVDDMMIQVKKIFTPSFEQHLLYLKKRYNNFNLNISDDGIVLIVNIDKKLFDKVSGNNLNKKFNMLNSDVYGINDFSYYNVFCFLERLYIVKYLTYLYLSYVEHDKFYDLNNDKLISYEEHMKEICSMNEKEFRNMYVDKINMIIDGVK